VLIVLLALAIINSLSTAEDSMLWNCCLMGNHQCGDVRQIAGFILRR
jgi:hypothetical protein